MKIITYRLSALLLLSALLVNACTVTTDGDFDSDVSNAKVTGIESFGWIYSDLIIEGSELDENCNNNTVTISKGSTEFALDLIDCTGSEVTAFIPEDVPTGVYKITADINNKDFTSIDGVDMEIEIKNRPVILDMSTTTMNDGETITISGLHLLNPTSISQNDPMVWIMKSGYTNNVSEITVDPDGTSATIIIDEGIPAGEYDLLLTTDEWSNKIVITIL